MNIDRWRQIDELFDAVLDLPEMRREEFLSEKCNGDEDLKNEVISLLKARTDSDNFLEKSAMGIAAKNLADEKTIVFSTYFLNQTIGTYKIEKQIGAGGMGEVYLAHDEKLRRRVALKILPAEYISNDDRVKRFQLEARAISALNHPNIVTIYDVGNFEGINYIATEYVEGKTLRELIGSGLKLKATLTIIIQACEALAAAHKGGIIHRDVKPENIMVRPDGYVKILDFGLAKLAEIDLNSLKNFTKTAKGVIIGTPAYMSPAQIADEKVDHRTDLWSIGVVLYELLTGVNPFKKENRQKTFQAILSEEPLLASSLNPEIPAELDQILVKALEKDVDLSYQTASDLRADVRRVKREVDSSPSLQSSSSKQRREDTKTRRWFLLFTFYFLLFTLIGVGLWFLLFRNNPNNLTEAIEWKNAKHLQLTELAGIEGYPSLSPDGKNIVYASDTGDNRDIYLQRVGGKNITNLTKDSKENDSMPVFSPDGKQIVFRSERQPNGIYLMEETGENSRRVSDTGFHPAWSPDSKTIVVSDSAAAVHSAHTFPNSSLWIIDIATGNKRKLDTKGDAIMPNWSPNGDRIAYWFIAEGQPGEIATISPETGDISIVTDNAASDWNPVWSPDGKFLYFGSDRAGNMNFWRVAIDEKTGKVLGAPESVPTPSKYCRHISFSRDGKLLAYIRYESNSNLQSLAFDEKTEKVGGEANWITRGDREVSNPQMSPNGQEIVFRNPTKTQEDLSLMNADGTNIRQLTNDKFRERNPRWSPIGDKIFFHSDRSGKFEIWSINPDGTNPQQITFTEKTGAVFPAISPDGNRLIFNQLDDRRQTPFIVDLTKIWQEQIPQNLPPFPNHSGSFASRDWSKEGDKILLNFFEEDGDESGIGVFSFSTARYEKLTKTGSNPIWLNDSRRFIFTDKKGIYLCDVKTKKVIELYTPTAYEIQNTTISPDNKTLFYRFLQIDADVWLIDASQNQ